MNESQFLSIIRVWAALAWADDVIADSEAAAMKRLIERAKVLTEEERATAYGFLTRKVELDTTNLAGLSPQVREGIYNAAARLAAIDQEFAEAERTLLNRLRHGLGLSEQKAREIESSYPILQGR